MSNYPDDIRQYDRDPRSPFYVEPRCPCCREPFDLNQCQDGYCKTLEVHFDSEGEPYDPEEIVE